MTATGPEHYEAVIGLEVHAQLSTATKIFCGCSTAFGAPPNSNVCPVCLGMPGTLPVLNRQVVEYALRLGLALGCRIASRSVFARKNYFYPDLPKGYQISQYEEPICLGGHVEVASADGSPKRVGITRIHMEEDAGKSIHDAGAGTLVDANRCGTPLLEIVSEPDLRTAQEAVQYLAFLRQTVRYLGICDGNMEEGSFRCDANVSVRRKGETRLGTKTEVKNMNSFSSVERAIEREIRRQIGIVEEGGAVVQQTLLWDAERGEVHPMRSKEEAHDYRYFPDPDLAPVLVDDAWIDEVRRSLPELPAATRARFAAEYELPEYDTGVLTQDRAVAEYYERTVRALAAKGRDAAKTASNWVMTDVLRALNERKCTVEEFPVSSARLAAMLDLLLDGTVSGTIAKELFTDMLVIPDAPKDIVARKGMAQVSDADAIGREIDAVLARFPAEIARFRSGEAKLMGFFVGETMKVMKGKGNPKLINELLRTKLEGRS